LQIGITIISSSFLGKHRGLRQLFTNGFINWLFKCVLFFFFSRGKVEKCEINTALHYGDLSPWVYHCVQDVMLCFAMLSTCFIRKKRWQQNKRHVSLCSINLQHKPSMEKDMGEMCGLLGNVQLGNLEF